MKKIVVLILIGVIFFLMGTTVGSFAVKPKTKDYFSDIVKTYSPAAAYVVFNYQGTLNKLSDSEIILVDNKGQKVTVPINEEMKKVMVYNDFLTQRPAQKSDFTIGSQIFVQLVTDWISGKVTNFTLALKQGN